MYPMGLVHTNGCGEPSVSKDKLIVKSLEYCFTFDISLSYKKLNVKAFYKNKKNFV
jgi:hypothetical protein